MNHLLESLLYLSFLLGHIANSPTLPHQEHNCTMYVANHVHKSDYHNVQVYNEWSINSYQALAKRGRVIMNKIFDMSDLIGKTTSGCSTAFPLLVPNNELRECKPRGRRLFLNDF